MNYESLYVNPNGRTSRAEYLPALIVLALAVAFYALFVTGRTAIFCALVLLYPGVVLLTRRLHDMGRSGWLLAVPTVVMLAAFGIWLHYFSLGAQLDGVVPLVALALAAAFVLWGCVGKAKGGTEVPEARKA